MTDASPIFNRQQLRSALYWQVRAAIGIGFVLVLSIVLMLILDGAGDPAAANALRGLVWLMAAGLLCDGMALLTTTAIAVIRLLEDRKSDTDEALEDSTRS